MAVFWKQCVLQKKPGFFQICIAGRKEASGSRDQNLVSEKRNCPFTGYQPTHLSILGMGLYKGLRKAGASIETGAAISAVLVLSYGELIRSWIHKAGDFYDALRIFCRRMQKDVRSFNGSGTGGSMDYLEPSLPDIAKRIPAVLWGSTWNLPSEAAGSSRKEGKKG